MTYCAAAQYLRASTQTKRRQGCTQWVNGIVRFWHFADNPTAPEFVRIGVTADKYGVGFGQLGRE